MANSNRLTPIIALNSGATSSRVEAARDLGVRSGVFQGCRHLLVFDGSLQNRGARLSQAQRGGNSAQGLRMLQMTCNALRALDSSHCDPSVTYAIP